MTDDPNTLFAGPLAWYVAAVLGHSTDFCIHASSSIYRNETLKLPRPASTGLRASSEVVGPEISNEMRFRLDLLRANSTSLGHFGHAAFVNDEFHVTIESQSLFDEIVYRSRHGNSLPGTVRFKGELCPPNTSKSLRWAVTSIAATVVHCVR